MPEVDLSELEGFMTNRRPVCSVAFAAELLDPKDRAVFLAALPLSSQYSGAGLSRWLKSKGVRISEGAIQRHRRDGCNCVS